MQPHRNTTSIQRNMSFTTEAGSPLWGLGVRMRHIHIRDEEKQCDTFQPRMASVFLAFVVPLTFNVAEHGGFLVLLRISICC
jgi:hypothetical protein